MRILIACEESQTVCIEMRKRGHEAFSCDLIPTSGLHPEWHIQGDVLEYLGKNKYNDFKGWDMMVGFPPCTDIAVSGSGSFEQKIKDGRQQKSIEFFMKIVNAPIEKVAIENPKGIMSTQYKKPDQIIHPYYFGDAYAKSTCLWLKNLPKLIHSNIDTLFEKQTHIDPEYLLYKSSKTKSGYSKYSKFGKLGKGKGKERSITPYGFAKAMAEQWTEDLNQTFIK